MVKIARLTAAALIVAALGLSVGCGKNEGYVVSDGTGKVTPSGSSSQTAITTSNQAQQSSTPQLKEQPKKSSTSKADSIPGVNNSIPLTKEKYDQINTGMSVDEVIGIMGGEGSSSESDFNGIKMVTMTYVNMDADYKTKMVYVAFVNGALSSKSETGL